MKIGIHTWGSEGDVRPFLALADGLVQAGHEVRLAYSAVDARDYSARLADAGYEHNPMTPPRSPEELRRLGTEVFADTRPLRQMSLAVKELLEPVIDEMTRSACELAQWADMLVVHFFAHPLAAAAQRERKPFVCVYPTAARATRAFPPPGLPHLCALNSLTWRLLLMLMSSKLKGSMNRVRTQLGLAPLGSYMQQMDQSAIDLIAMSPTLLQRPDDWPEKMHLSGFLSPPPATLEQRPHPQLEAFLAQGAAPVYVTFGSMAVAERDPRGMVELLERSLAAAGVRAIIQTEVPGPTSAQTMRVSGAISHDQVFPRCAAIVHHGGAGTTQAALRAGRPSVVVAHIADQFMWGRQLHRLGVAPPHLARRTLASKPLAHAIEAATRDAPMRARAERLGEQMRAEDGVRRAVELIGLQGPR